MGDRELNRSGLLVRIRGDSMAPVFGDGDLVEVDPNAYRDAAPAAGDVVLARHPFRAKTWIVKRVVRIETDGRCVLEGDNRWESSDSRSFGPLRPERIAGRVIGRAN